MKRTLEKLAAEREEIDKAFSRKLDEIKRTLPLLAEKRTLLKKASPAADRLLSQLAELAELQKALADARDREWDALGSNHVGMIFQSLEWRVDKLAAEHEDVQVLMKKLRGLREVLDRLLAALEEKNLPAPKDVRNVLEPLEDWRYAGFESRFRGSPQAVKKQLEAYVPYLPKRGRILDLGCGRGEFLDLLRENGLDGAGIDLNSLMVEACRDRGLRCEKGDLLEKLAAEPDGSLAGIFSSQVIEHLTPVQVRKLVELARRKLEPGGVLILETINPLSVFALVQIFNLDPTHQKPVHPQGLKFLLEDAGFEDVEIRYSAALEKERLRDLPPADDRTVVLNENFDRLNDLLYAPAQYAAIARRR
jgi:O-antigen chain-terminating methyltransferase